MSFTCPYCDESFEMNDILYYADASEKKFVTRITGDLNTEQSPSASAEIPSSAKNTHFDIFSFSSIAQKPEVNESPEGGNAEESENKEKFPLGVLVEDTVIRDFLKDYGEGKFFRFRRTARFYGIRSKDEIGDDQGYGYVQNNNGDIPFEIYVPSRSKEQKRVTHPICPHCHCDLPWKYFNTPEQNRHIVALSGCTAAGKTQYITVALADLINNKFVRMGLGKSIELTICSKWFHDMYLDDFSSTGGLAATEKSMLFPIILQVTDSNNNTHFITFHDCAGEYTDDAEYALNRPGFRLADTLMVMADAAQLFGASLEEGERCSLGDYLDALKPMYVYHDDLLPRLQRVIVVLTKCDSIIGPGKIIHELVRGTSTKMISYSSSLECHNNQIDLHTIQLNSDQLVTLMHENSIPSVKDRIVDTLNKERIKQEDITIFAVSTYSRNNGNSSFEKVKEIRGANFHRLVEPLLFAMYDWGIVEGTYSHENSGLGIAVDVNRKEKTGKGIFGLFRK